MNETDLIKSFIFNIGIDKSPNTITSYESDLTLLHKFLIEIKKNFINCTENDLNQYFSQYFLKDKYGFIKIAEATSIRRKISCFRSFFQFLLEQNTISQNPILEIDIPKKSHNLPFYLTKNEIDALFKHTSSKNTKEFIRNNAIFRILYSSGLRISECISLKLNEITDSNGKIRKKVIITGKGNKERIIFFDKETQTALEKYLLFREQYLKNKKNSFVFCSNSKSGHISRESAFLNLRNIANLINLSERLSPHKLRHSFATHLYQNGIDLRLLQTLLGHSDISTTEIYTHIKAEEIQTTVENFHPMFRKK